MDHADLFDALASGPAHLRSRNVQAAPVGGFGGVQVADGGQVHVGVAEVEVGDGFGGGVADALVVADGFFVGRHAVGAALLPQDLAQGDDADTASVRMRWRWSASRGAAGGRARAGAACWRFQATSFSCKRGRRGEVAVVVLGQVDAVAHDQAVAVFPAGDGGVVRRAVVGRDFGHQPGPFGRAALVLVEDCAGPAWRR